MDLKVHLNSGDSQLVVHAIPKNSRFPVGFLTGTLLPDHLHIGTAELEDHWHGHGLGSAMYEALFAHAHHQGVKKVAGGTHSTSAHKVHQKLAQKHGLGYEAKQVRPTTDEGRNDDAYGPYKYTLKSEQIRPTSSEKEQPVFNREVSGSSPESGSTLLDDSDTLEKSMLPLIAGMMAAVPTTDLAAWSPKGLHNELVPIAHLESSFGQHMNHAPSSKGEYHSALGALGIKPVTVHEEYLRSPSLQKLYPGLTGPETFTQKLKKDPQFYNVMGGAHWVHLKRVLGSPEKAAYGWRWGIGAAKGRVDPEHDPYVAKYKALSRGVQAGHLKKGEIASDVDRLLTADEIGDRLMGLKLVGDPQQLNGYLDAAAARGNEDNRVISALLQNPSLDGEQLHRILGICSPECRAAVLQHPNSDDHHVGTVLESDPSRADLVAAVQHPHVRPAQILVALDAARALGTKLPEALPYFGRPDLLSEDISTYIAKVTDPDIEDQDSEFWPVLAHHPNLSLRDFEALLSSQHPMRQHVLTRKMSEPELLRYAADPRLNNRFDKTDALTVLRSQPRLSDSVCTAFAARPFADIKTHLAGLRYAQEMSAVGKELEDSTFGKSLKEWLPLQKMAVHPKDMKGLARALTSEGPQLVDHKPHLEAHPEAHQHLVNDYRKNVLESGDQAKRVKAPGAGITRKVVYKLPAEAAQHDLFHPSSGRTEDRRFMVKPYHEAVSRRLTNWMQHPIQGWAEMATQGLFHAAGIGDLHQKVHVSEHPVASGRSQPMLVVALEPNMETIYDRYKRYGFHSPGHEEKTKVQARKIGIMDWLTNNLDRHMGNLLVNHQTGDLLAIDHSRNFQYRNNDKERRPPRGAGSEPLVDNFNTYLRNSALSYVDPHPSTTGNGSKPRRAEENPYERHMGYMQDYAPIINEWWPSVSKQVRAEMQKHLQSIKDPEVRAHISRNFEKRADILDQMADFGLENFGVDDWHSYANAPFFRYGTNDHELPDWK